MQRSVTFSEENIHKLFGHEAAEDEEPERLRQYYFKARTFEQMATDLPLRILVGHKGIGKSALFKVAMAEEKERKHLSILIQPNDIADISTNATDFLLSIRQWTNGLNGIITRKVLESLGISSEHLASAKNYGGQILQFLIDTFKNYKQIE